MELSLNIFFSFLQKTLNGHVANLTDGKNEKSPAKEKESKRSPTKEPTTPKQQKEKRQDNNASKQAEKNKKNELTKPKKNETLEEIKNKKNTKKLLNEKPLDYDDDSWETVPSKFDKKKKQESPVKKSKKDNKKVEKLVEIEKLVKEEVNKELREKEKVIKVEVVNSNETPKKEALSSTVIDAAVEEKKEKKKEKKQQKNKAEKQEPQTVVAQSKPIEKIIEQPSIKKTIDIEAPKKVEPVTDGIVAFDELGGTCTIIEVMYM